MIPPRIYNGGACALLIGLIMCATLGGQSTASADQPLKAPPIATRIDYLPDTRLTDQTGAKVSLASVKGKPALVGFIHTSCEGPCELMTAKMKNIADDLAPAFAAKVTLVSVTTDPAEDGPAQLAAYAKAHDAVGKGWLFLTGQPANVRKILKLYGVPADTTEDSMTHVFELRLIGASGQELHRYEGSDIKAATVAADIQTALAKP